MEGINATCRTNHYINSITNPLISAFMFSAGVVGNLAALLLLEYRRLKERGSSRGQRRSLFQLLVTSLVVTDLAGTCFISPLVQVAYLRNTTLLGMAPETGAACKYFGSAMTFFSLATLSLLFAMAMERCLAISYPYFYNSHVTRKCGYITIPFVYSMCALLCLLPFAGFGDYVQYCPGTWCFIDMNPELTEHRVYANTYATFMLTLVLATVACNGSVVYHLVRMYQRRRRNRGSLTASTRNKKERRKLSLAEEVEHLILLVVMTIIYIICTMPLVIRVYINSKGKSGNSSEDLQALRIISVNSIVDPLGFIFLSPSVLHFCWAAVCRAPLDPPSPSPSPRSSCRKESCHAQLQLCRPPSDCVGPQSAL